MLKDCVALGLLPLLAVTVPVNVPNCVGFPEMTPAEERVSPVGKAPELTVKTGLG